MRTNINKNDFLLFGKIKDYSQIVFDTEAPIIFEFT